MNRLARITLLGLAALLTASCSGDDEEEGRDEGVCPQVVVWARPPAGGECQSFPTPCDVTEGFVQCCGRGVGGCIGPDEKTCVDDPTDSCNPELGADCSGICQ